MSNDKAQPLYNDQDRRPPPITTRLTEFVTRAVEKLTPPPRPDNPSKRMTYTHVVLIGPHTSIESVEYIRRSLPDSLILGDGINPLTVSALKSELAGRISENSRVDLMVHGNVSSKNQHRIMLLSSLDSSPTICFLFFLNKILKQGRSTPKPLNTFVHLWACYSGAASTTIMPPGLALVTHGDRKLFLNTCTFGATTPHNPRDPIVGIILSSLLSSESTRVLINTRGENLAYVIAPPEAPLATDSELKHYLLKQRKLLLNFFCIQEVVLPEEETSLKPTQRSVSELTAKILFGLIYNEALIHEYLEARDGEGKHIFNPNERNPIDGRSLLEFFLYIGRIDIADILMKLGANFNLHNVITTGNVQIFNYLCNKGLYADFELNGRNTSQVLTDLLSDNIAPEARMHYSEMLRTLQVRQEYIDDLRLRLTVAQAFFEQTGHLKFGRVLPERIAPPEMPGGAAAAAAASLLVHSMVVPPAPPSTPEEPPAPPSALSVVTSATPATAPAPVPANARAV